jgi:hypothetical protein
MEEVIPRLYISNLDAASDKTLRVSKGITHIISVGCQLQEAVDEVISSSKVTLLLDERPYHVLQYPEIRDLPDSLICGLFEETNEFISEALSTSPSSAVLVHCVYGQSRSATIVLAYILSEHHVPKLSLEEAYCLLKRIKPDICINPGFLSQVPNSDCPDHISPCNIYGTCARYHSFIFCTTNQASRQNMSSLYQRLLLSAATMQAPLIEAGNAKQRMVQRFYGVESARKLCSRTRMQL